jgi:hypothetical protein
MGENGRIFYQQELSIEVGARRLAEALESAVWHPYGCKR